MTQPRKPFVYEGRIRVFDPEPGDVIYLLDHPQAEEGWGPNLTDLIGDWRGEWTFGDVPGRFRITVEELRDNHGEGEK